MVGTIEMDNKKRGEIRMKLFDLITELQNISDNFGDAEVEVANDCDDILDTWTIDRVCFFKDGEIQTVIIVEK